MHPHGGCDHSVADFLSGDSRVAAVAISYFCHFPPEKDRSFITLVLCDFPS